MKIKNAVVACFILPIGVIITASNVHSQVTFSNITNATLYATDYMQSTNSGGSSYNYTPGANGGTVASSGVIHSNSYGTNSATGSTAYWATLASGQDGWTNFGVPNGNGPGTIFYSRANSSRTNPAGMSIGADQWYSTDQADGVLGTYPQSATTYLAQSLYSGTGTNAIHFDSTFWLLANGGNNTNGWDTLGWSLMNSSQQTLLSINLNDIAGDGSAWQLSVTAAGNTSKQVLSITNTTWTTLSGNSITHLGFNILNIGQTNEAIQVLQYNNTSSTNIPTVGAQGNFGVISTALITDGTNASTLSGGDSVGYLANFWTLADTNSTDLYTNTDNSVSTVYTNFAQNNMMMMSTLISVPEPKTWILFGLSGLALVVYLRKRDA